MTPRPPRRAHLRRWASPLVAAAYSSYASLLGARPPCIWTLLDGLGADSRRRPVLGGIGVSVAAIAVLGIVGTAGAQAPPVERLTSLESEHVVVRFDPELDWILARPALEALAAARAVAGDLLGELPAGRTRVDIAPTVEEFGRVSGLTPEQIEAAGAVAASDGDRVTILSPRLLLRGYPWRDTLNHEYARELIVRLSANRAPVWLQEGLARLVERRWRSPEAPLLDEIDRSLVARALRENGLIPLGQIRHPLAHLDSRGAVRLALAESALAAEHLIAGSGVEGLRRLIAELGRAPAAGAFDEALRVAIGQPFAAFEAGWRGAIGGRGYQELGGLALPSLRLAGRGAAEEWELAEWQPVAAQNHLRLGDLLRARGNTRVALIEYEKARKIAPGSPLAHLKAARALIELGRADQAAAAAREARRLGGGYPAASVALAAALTATGDREGAAAALRDALEINPFDPFAWRDLGRTLRRLGRLQEAQSASVNALRLAPGNQEFMQSVMENP